MSLTTWNVFILKCIFVTGFPISPTLAFQLMMRVKSKKSFDLLKRCALSCCVLHNVHKTCLAVTMMEFDARHDTRKKKKFQASEVGRHFNRDFEVHLETVKREHDQRRDVEDPGAGNIVQQLQQALQPVHARGLSESIFTSKATPLNTRSERISKSRHWRKFTLSSAVTLLENISVVLFCVQHSDSLKERNTFPTFLLLFVPRLFNFLSSRCLISIRLNSCQFCTMIKC